MSPKNSEEESLKKTEKEQPRKIFYISNRRLGRPVTRAFLKANWGLVEELKRSLKNQAPGRVERR